MKAVVTGIAGFAGRHLAAHLLAEGDDVLGVVRAPVATGSLPAQSTGGPADCLTWDFAAGAPSAETADRLHAFAPDCIYHLAAISFPDLCGEQEPTASCLATNVYGTQRVAELALRLPSRPRVIFASSSRVYANVSADAPRVDEQFPPRPTRGYGQSKLAAEQALQAAVCERGLDAVIARAFQHTGPGQDPRMMLPEWSRQLAAPHCETLVVRHLDASIDCSDVRDVVRAYRLLAAAGQRGMIYNVGSGVARRTGDVIEELCRLADRHPRISERAPGFKQDPIANIDRLVAATGWRTEISWERTLRDTLDDWRRRLAPAVNSATSLEPIV